jgi:hypothetical protein
MKLKEKKFQEVLFYYYNINLSVLFLCVYFAAATPSQFFFYFVNFVNNASAVVQKAQRKKFNATGGLEFYF